MQHFVDGRNLPKQALPFVVCTTLIATPVSTAQAAPLDGVVDFATSSPLVTFGLGCAAGAIIGGLAVGLSGRSARRRLQDEIDEVVKTAERAEESARRAEALLAKQEAKLQVPTVQGAQPKAQAQAQKSAVQTVQRPVAQAGAMPETTKPKATAAAEITNALSREKLAQAVRKSDASVEDDKGTTHRLGRRAARKLVDLPVIDRGAVRDADVPFTVVATPRHRQLSPMVKASLIDRRVPRFDESLYPDTTSELHQEADVFETAMRAMDATLSDSGSMSLNQAVPEVQATADLARNARPDMSDTSSYIDYLVKDELERNRSGAGRRFSRAHLTMFEGTGDLSAARKALQYRPRHMQRSSKEA